MNNEELKKAIVDLLYDLHEGDHLNLWILDRISKIFSIDAVALCEENGITYNLN
jgi:hypothetical protein